ncbi:Lrp/AsnC family transcriptional regulator [Cryptosporangium phraense]|uniref:Lrp/AsnC family transcriptional regulator n=1 Tax=Cryptosporangium phraense TaxID=2593070 RepID=A0A545AHA6_9ACTN|nr:Lrp/AsnC family transcriptional regulator [Cryptosporangium phraense]TQS40704.1 Lrp/AsnC family transcriptional regulator [Cryptosporangium phraense]
MDDIDSAILAHLQRDARQTNRELAAAVGLAPSTCLERVRALRAAGVLTGFHAAVDLAALNRTVQALISVQLRPLNREVIQNFKSYTAGLPEVLSVYVVTGPQDILLHVAVPDVDAMHTFLMDRITVRREVVGFNTSVIYQHTSNPVVSRLP